MAYQSLYRKYRPQTFSDVMGQGHVTRTLQNALASGRVAHGYLFTGTRGTAKTTVARLLAKALNCLLSDRPTPEPCNKCAACTSITAGACIDVIEMDAASHRGVADIEEVRKAVGYGPMEMRYKVFIIDEAHQLSSDAKDAFLKTLEEPPDNVVFILATTEPQAIPITIRSRCQQFDFKRGTLHDIAARLRYVLDCEGVTYTSDAINLVARGAEGSWRDALSLLEQVLAFAPAHITGADVDAVLGTLDQEMLARVTQAVAERDAPGAFSLAGQLLDAGKEARTLLRTLSAHFRDLLMVSVGGPAVGMEFTPDEVGRLQAEARAFTPPQMMRAMDVLNEAQGETRWNNQHRLLVELAFLKLMTLGDAPPPVKGATASPLPQTVFATAPIVYAAPQAAVPQIAPQPVVPQVQVVESAPLPPNNGRTSPARGLRGDVLETPRPVTEEKPLSQNPLAGDVRPLLGGRGAASETEDDTIAPAFFASDAIDDEDDYAPSHGDDDAPAMDEDEDDEDTTVGAATTADPVRASFIAARIEDAVGADDAEDKEPVDDGPSLFDELPNATPAFLPPRVERDTPPVSVAAAQTTPVEATPVAQPIAAPDLLALDADDDAGEAFEAVEDDAQDEPDTAIVAPPVIAATPPTQAAAQAAPEPSEPEGPPITLDDVLRAWPEFLRKAGMVSKKTEMMMLSARPVSADRSGIEIAFGSRATFEMMNTPVALGFVRNVLLRSLGVSHVAVRFMLDNSAAPAPPKRAPAKEKKTVRDPLAELDALEKGEMSLPRGYQNGFGNTSGSGSASPWGNSDGTVSGVGNGFGGTTHHAPPSPSPYNFSGNGNPNSASESNGPPAFSPPRREPVSPPAYGGSQNGRRPSGKDEWADIPAYQSAPVAAASGAKSAQTTALHAVLLENALVQDVLSIFGGELTDD